MIKKLIKRLWILLLVFNGVHNSFSQGIDNIWLMGYDSWAGPPWGNNTFDFSGGNLSIDSVSRKMNFSATVASICDKNGNLLFYTNGIWIANSTNDTMQNGAGLNPGYLTSQFFQDGLPIPQGVLIFPFPDDTSKYYLLHETVSQMGLYTPSELLYSLIDMNLDNGLGGLISKNNIIINDTLVFGEIIGVKHGNGRDWWVLAHRYHSDMFYELLVTPLGITVFSSQFVGKYRLDGIQAAFSPEGTKYACYNTLDDLEIFDFDRCTGLLSNHINISINDSMVGGGVAFSPSGRYVYASSIKYVYQFDLQASNIAASMQTVAVWDGFYSPAPPYADLFLLMQLAPDGKIYINSPNSVLDMHVINYPDSAGLSCDVKQHSVHLNRFNWHSIPNYPNYFLGRDVGSPCDSLTPVNEIVNNTLPIRINPNPAQNTFYLNYELPYGKTAIATVYNTLGEVVMRKVLYWYFGYLQVDCSGLENGVYIVKVEGNGIKGYSKLVIER